ncbi:ribosomal protein L18e/L15 superfamily protein [Actinidia rufa]|uniref:Ribosomal protein L18e/L15 superfamily protein n=1 Tax=Actinidia rufa TaxID=165716 RepID=A0A7J0GMF6_9ERIC|nr:ribosomal protein L18e/L15 superfamily protein [Actinidia rufa]
MTTRFRKNRKKRGHVSAGHGRIGKHRKHPGGRGKRRWHAPPPHPLRQVPSRIFRQGRHEELKEKATSDNVPMIDVTQFGYFKVLGKGVLPENRPVVVKAKLVSKTAEKEDQGGRWRRCSHRLGYIDEKCYGCIDSFAMSWCDYLGLIGL